MAVAGGGCVDVRARNCRGSVFPGRATERRRLVAGECLAIVTEQALLQFIRTAKRSGEGLGAPLHRTRPKNGRTTLLLMAHIPKLLGYPPRSHRSFPKKTTKESTRKAT
jgi:hypothetical protein